MAKKELLIDIRTRIDKFQDGLNKVDRRLYQTQRRIQGFTNIVAGMGLTIASGLSIAGLSALAERVTQTADAIAKLAKATNTSTEFLQKWDYAAQRSGISSQQAEQALKTFHKTFSNFKAGYGTFAENMRKNNAFGDLAERLKDVGSTEKALEIVIQKIKEIKDPTERARLATSAFGDSAANIAMIADDYERLKKHAEELGIIKPPEFFEKAEQISDDLLIINKILDTQSSTLLIKLAPAWVTLQQKIIDAIDAYNEFTRPRTNQDKMAEDLKRLEEIKRILKEDDGPLWMGLDDRTKSNLVMEMNVIQARMEHRVELMSKQAEQAERIKTQEQQRARAEAEALSIELKKNELSVKRTKAAEEYKKQLKEIRRIAASALTEQERWQNNMIKYQSKQFIEKYNDANPQLTYDEFIKRYAQSNPALSKTTKDNNPPEWKNDIQRLTEQYSWLDPDKWKNTQTDKIFNLVDKGLSTDIALAEIKRIEDRYNQMVEKLSKANSKLTEETANMVKSVADSLSDYFARSLFDTEVNFAEFLSRLTQQLAVSQLSKWFNSIFTSIGTDVASSLSTSTTRSLSQPLTPTVIVNNNSSLPVDVSPGGFTVSGRDLVQTILITDQMTPNYSRGY